MGYSCSAKANDVLDAIIELAHESGIKQSNGLPFKCFWEIGREQPDGAITGTVWKPYPPDPERVTRAGSFRINPDGRIIRFPRLPLYWKKEACRRAAKR